MRRSTVRRRRGTVPTTIHTALVHWRGSSALGTSLTHTHRSHLTGTSVFFVQGSDSALTGSLGIEFNKTTSLELSVSVDHHVDLKRR